MKTIRPGIAGFLRTGAAFGKWALYAIGVGILVGAVGAAFHIGIDWAAGLRAQCPRIVWLLPVGGVAIVLLYRACGMEKDRGTNLVLAAVREAEPIRLRTAPLIFLSTIITHLVGGSAGREGAALQLGGSLAACIGRKIRLDAKDGRVMVMCGMSAAFSALFGTPITAAVFSMEVVSVGVMYYAAIVPCLISAQVGLLIARCFGLHLEGGYLVPQAAVLSPWSMLQAAALGALCALVSIVFCVVMHRTPKLYGRCLPSTLLRAAVGGGQARPEAFLLKILFTAVTLGAGFKGGEIVPVFFTGATFGCVAAPFLGLPASFGAALGMTAVFCGVTNCPMTSLFLAYELFGGQGLPLFALSCAVAYMLSGYYGLYSEQKIVYSKFRPEFIDKKAE